MLECGPIKLRGLHQIDYDLTRFWVLQSGDHGQVDGLEVRELIQQYFERLLLMFARDQKIDVFRYSCFFDLHPAKSPMSAHQNKRNLCPI